MIQLLKHWLRILRLWLQSKPLDLEEFPEITDDTKKKKKPDA